MSSSTTESSTNSVVATPESPALSTSVAPSTTSSTADGSSLSTSDTTTAAAPTLPSTTSDGPRIVHIDMTSDNICPWCYIGKRRLERAISQLDPHRVTPVVRVHPFFLDSTLPKQSMEKMQHYHTKFGADRTKAMLARMKSTGQQEGITFSYGGKIGSTLQSHRLLKYVERKGGKEGESEVETWRRVSAMVDILFSSYFEHEEDIADSDTLARLAVKLPELGGREKEVREWLDGKEEEANVQNEVSAYQQQQQHQSPTSLTLADRSLHLCSLLLTVCFSVASPFR